MTYRDRLRCDMIFHMVDNPFVKVFIVGQKPCGFFHKFRRAYLFAFKNLADANNKACQYCGNQPRQAPFKAEIRGAAYQNAIPKKGASVRAYDDHHPFHTNAPARFESAPRPAAETILVMQRTALKFYPLSGRHGARARFCRRSQR